MPLYSIKYCHDTGWPFKGAWLKDRESTANFFSARIYMKVIDKLYSYHPADGVAT